MIYWREAAQRYPRAEGALARADIAQLERRGDAAASMAYRKAHRDYRGAAGVLVLCPFSGDTVLVPLRWTREGRLDPNDNNQSR